MFRWLMGITAVRKWRPYIAFLLIFVMLLADIFWFVNSGFFRASTAESAAGDFSVFREAVGTTVIAGTGNNITWDTPVSESVNIDLQANTSDIDLVNSGRYLVLYNAWTEEGAAGGNNRRSVASYLTLNGSPLEYGWGGGYIRDQENDFTAYNSGGAIINAVAGDDLALVLDRDDTNGGADTEVRDATNGISVLKLDDDLDFLRVHSSAGTSDISGNTTFTGVNWDTVDEVDVGSFGFSNPDTDITVKGGSTQKFLVTANVKLNVPSAGPRQNYELRLALDGSEIPGTRTTTYLRNDDGTLNGTLQYTGIIQKTASGDQTLTVDVRREGTSSGVTAIAGDETAISVVALPSDAEVLSLVNNADEALTSTQSTLSFGNQISTSANLSHSTSSNPDDITIDTGGDYLMFATTYTSRTSGTGRDVPKIDWLIDGGVQTYGGHGSFNRGAQGGEDTNTSGASSGAIFPGLTSSQVIELAQSDETTGTPVADFLADRVAVQIVEMTELIQGATTNVVVNDGQIASTSIPATDVFSGEQYSVIESTAPRNITNIVLSESGSIDAQSNLSNVGLFYDLDTTFPYNCADESYGGSESQFGSDGAFSGADGSITFNDSVSISVTSAFCAYVVYDIASGAQDGDTINFQIEDPSTDVIVTAGGTVVPGNPVGDIDFTTIENPEITQTGYHWRNDDGSETSATSATGGVENTPGLAFSAATPQRLRIGVAGAGTGEETNQYRLEYGQKVTTCGDVGSWTDVGGVGGDWDMFNSANLTEGGDTTNISVANGGVTDGGTDFISSNGGLRDLTSQTSDITIRNEVDATVAEFGNVSVTNGSVTTITLNSTFTNPVVVASARYPRTATQRTSRVSNKTSTSFDVLVDNFDGSLGVGTSELDYVVFEAGEWTLDGVQLYASTTSTAVTDGRALADNPGGVVVTYPTSFTNPVVLASMSTDNDPDWAFATVYDGTNVDNPPTGTSFTTFINDNWDADGHTATEDIDFVVFEEGSGTSNSLDFDAVTSGSANVSNTPISINYGSAYSATPGVIIVQALTQLGSDGGYAQIDTNTAPTASAVTLSTDEEGLGADRGHAAEEVAIVSFETDGEMTTVLPGLSEFVELEYSIQATGSAVEGAAYCFRVTDAGTALRNYDNYPEATLSADVTVFASDTQIASVAAGSTDVYIGGKFTIQANSANYTLTDLQVVETGTIDAAQYLSNPRIAYDRDTTNPRDCVDEVYDGNETVLTGTAFTSPNGTTSVSLSQLVRTNRPVCAYVVFDVASDAPDGDTIEFEITSPNVDVVLTGATVGPGSAVSLAGTTVVDAPALTQAGYHWRNDDGSESGATSATEGVENTPVTAVFQDTVRRLRMSISNDGSLTESGAEFRLEYGTKITTCSNVGIWERVDTGIAFDMASTSQLTDGSDTTEVAVADGGITDSNTLFVTPNNGQKEDSDQTAAISITNTEYVEVEYAITVTDVSAFGATYCFRLTNQGEVLAAYSNFAELTVQDRQDFFIQRGTETASGTGITLVAGTDYTAPSSGSAAFVRITNTSMTGAGSDTLGSTRSPDDLTAYIEIPTDLTTGFTITRPSTAVDNTRVSWEIIEYIGVPGGDNEMIVRDAATVTYGGSNLQATGTAVGGVADDSDVVVFITGQINPATGTGDYNTGLSISSWNASTSEPVFERGDADGIAAGVSYAVVEFTGENWNIQRAEHTFTAAGVTEQESITSVNSLSRTFLHSQKLSGDELFNLDESGHEVWLSSIGAVSFLLESGSTNPSDQKSVAWVIENVQNDDGSLAVYRSNGLIVVTTGQPNIYQYNIGTTVTPENATIWANNRSTGAGPAHPRALLGVRIINENQYELWKSDENQNQNFRVEVVEWPVANTSIRQSYYRFYVDNDAITPVDPWPVGVEDLGENSAMTDLDNPLGEGERTRIRTSLFVNNATLAAGGVSFKLQYGRRVTTCSAVSSWDDVGDPAGGEIWRGYDATPVDGTELPSTLISVSDVSGSYEELNPSAANPNSVDIGEHIEYDWVIENNGALQKNSYCFRMVENDGSVLEGYDVYPTVRTSGYTVVIDNWRWYDDENNLNPNSPLAGERVAPSNVSIGNALKLRVSTAEIESANGVNIKFNLEYSEYADFRDGGTLLTATSSCSGNSLWCYFDGAGNDSEIIDQTVLSGVNSCVSGVGNGCGTRNEAVGLTSMYDQPALTVSEHEFTLVHDGARANALYYFRLVDATNGVDLLASSSYPSLMVEGPLLTFVVDGIDSGTVVEGVTIDATSTATGIDFGSVPLDTDIEAGQRLTVFTNGTEGYQVYMEFLQDLQDSYGNAINSISSQNDSPSTWESQCTGTSTSCFGYHAGDNVLYEGSVRFAADNTYAGVENQPVEVMASNVPVTFDVSDIVYRIRADQLQPAGEYTAAIRYIIVPKF